MESSNSSKIVLQFRLEGDRLADGQLCWKVSLDLAKELGLLRVGGIM